MNGVTNPTDLGDPHDVTPSQLPFAEEGCHCEESFNQSSEKKIYISSLSSITLPTLASPLLLLLSISIYTYTHTHTHFPTQSHTQSGEGLADDDVETFLDVDFHVIDFATEHLHREKRLLSEEGIVLRERKEGNK